MFLLNPQSKLPLYEQLVEQLRKQIVLGNAAPGSPLPSVRQLSVELGVNPNTIQKAYREMEQSGMIETIRGKGTFMADIPSTARNEGVIRKMKTEIEKNCMELIYQGLGKEEIIALVEEAVDQLLAGKGEKND